MASAAKRPRLGADRVVLECNDLRAMIFSFTSMETKLSVLARVNRTWKRCVYTCPAAWVGPIDLEYHQLIPGIPRNLTWLAATRSATVVVPSDARIIDLNRILKSGTNMLSIALTNELASLWVKTQRHHAVHSRITHARLANDGRSVQRLPPSITSLDARTSVIPLNDLVVQLPNLTELAVSWPNHDDMRSISATKIQRLFVHDMNGLSESITLLPQSIHTLFLRNCLSDADVSAIARHLPNLKSFGFATPRDVISLEHVRDFRALETLVISWAMVSETEALAALPIKRLICVHSLYTALLPTMTSVRHVLCSLSHGEDAWRVACPNLASIRTSWDPLLTPDMFLEALCFHI